eukprot:SAG31_NODE_14875_length_782_cov_1.446559_2_plen_126_part_01
MNRSRDEYAPNSQTLRAAFRPPDVNGGGTCVHICPAGFWVGMIYTTVSVFILKLCAIVGEQKGIGENLGKSLFVRKTIGVNKSGIRAFQKVLEAPGLDWRKVMILVGGPDWPVSVLTGILRLNVFQ